MIGMYATTKRRGNGEKDNCLFFTGDIESNITKTDENVSAGAQELKKANEYQKVFLLILICGRMTIVGCAYTTTTTTTQQQQVIAQQTLLAIIVSRSSVRCSCWWILYL
jgi:hypothetical protein